MNGLSQNGSGSQQRPNPVVAITPAAPSSTLPVFPADTVRHDNEKHGAGPRAPSPYTRHTTEAETTRLEIHAVLRMVRC